MEIIVPFNEIWIVTAKSGRHSGSAYVRASSKKEANDIAQSCGWLESGRVIKSQTCSLMKWYEENEGVTNMQELYDDFLSSTDVDAINSLSEIGKWYEIEWGC